MNAVDITYENDKINIFVFQDIDGCMSSEEISDKLSLYKLCVGKSWHVQSCDARSGSGLTDGLDWLSRQLVASEVFDMS